RGGGRLVGVDVEECAQDDVDGGDAVQVGAGEHIGGDLNGGVRVGRGDCAGADDGDRAHSSSWISGTVMWPSTAAGAPQRACAGLRVFSTTSSRKTLVMAMGWDVAGTSSVAISDTEATACMMESNSPAKRSISSSVSWIRARSARR